MDKRGRSWVPDDIERNKPSVARMYDYYLGGYHNFAIDRAAAKQAIAIYSDLPNIMQVNRGFLRRAVRYLTKQGIDQFLDIGSGIPTVGNVHLVAQETNPQARVVYVDSDPVAVAHSTLLLRTNPHAIIVQGDACHPEQFLSSSPVQDMLDFNRPVAILLVFLLHFIADDDIASKAVRTLRDVMAAGSYLVLSHGTSEEMPLQSREPLTTLYAGTTNALRLRPRSQIVPFFDGLELIDPGLVFTPLWQPEDPLDLFLDHPERSSSYAAVGRKN